MVSKAISNGIGRTVVIIWHREKTEIYRVKIKIHFKLQLDVGKRSYLL